MTSHQDWTPIKIHGHAGRGAVPVVVSATTYKGSPEAAHARKLAETDDPVKLKTLTGASRQEIVVRRAANKWSQQDLNQQCNFPVNTIREIEAGRLTPTIQQLNTLNRILKTGLKLG
jgi:ribosome-binding protein aMBF1 (putative translation factor)